jgi:hypothetical protein
MHHREKSRYLRWRWIGLPLSFLVFAVALTGSNFVDGSFADHREDAMGIKVGRHWVSYAAAAVGLAPAPAVSAPLPPPPTQIGMNVPAVSYYAGTFPFANLIIGSVWQSTNWQRLPETLMTPDGDLRALPDGGAIRIVSVPFTGAKGDDIVCTYSGSAVVTAAGTVRNMLASAGEVRFHVARRPDQQVSVWLNVNKMDPARPIRNLDCRSEELSWSVRFRPQFIETIRGYSVLRFMDWQNSNENIAVPWAERHTLANNRKDRDGIPIEAMMALVKEVDADPWFVMPWNASNDYITNFAQMIHDGLAANRHVYVEVGNEVWNGSFGVSRQATKEGLAEGLSGDAREANLRRYAERAIEVMKLWERVFADRRGLVRVVSTQHVVPHSAQEVLNFRDMAAHVDALATAPYFGATIGGNSPGTADAMIERLQQELQLTVQKARENRAVAAQFHKRYIAYEGGQGMILPGAAELFKQVERDPRMYNLYKNFLTAWKSDIGDVLCLLTSTAPISSQGAWGLTEYENQPVEDAPKLRAVLEARKGLKH